MQYPVKALFVFRWTLISRLYLLNNQSPAIFSPVLAAEIGLNESLIYLTIERLCAERGNHRDGHRWFGINNKTAATLFNWGIGLQKIQTVYDALLSKKYIIEANFKIIEKDSTRFFAINYETAKHLKSVAVIALEELSQDKPAQRPMNGNLFVLEPPRAQQETYEQRFYREVKAAIYECCNINLTIVLNGQKAKIEKQADEAAGSFRKQYPDKLPGQLAKAIIVFGWYWTSKTGRDGNFFSPPSISVLRSKHWDDFMLFLKKECDNRLPEREFFEIRKGKNHDFA